MGRADQLKFIIMNGKGGENRKILWEKKCTVKEKEGREVPSWRRMVTKQNKSSKGDYYY